MNFQKRFIRESFASGRRVSVLSIPRGNGKSTLCGHILARCLTPRDPLHESGKEYLLVAGSLLQARHVFNAILDMLEDIDDYRILQSTAQLKITHKATRTRLQALSSNAKTAMGIGLQNPVVVADEPGSWETGKGYLMYQALTTSIGKPDSVTRLIFIGTLAPSMRGWWVDLVNSETTDKRFVMKYQGNLESWESKKQLTKELRRVNPLMWKFKESRQQLLAERDDAFKYPSQKATFNSYRLNIPSQELSETLLSPEDWRAVVSRTPRDPAGIPVVGVDLGGARAWSAAVAIFENGFIEAVALTGGIPSIDKQEARDRIERGTYQSLVDKGLLLVDDGRKVPRLKQLVEHITNWNPSIVVCDRFRQAQMEDEAPNLKFLFRRQMWDESTDDINSLRKLAADGPLNIGDSSDLIMESMSVSTVKLDDKGNSRITKEGKFNHARDDVAVAFTLAAGEFERRRRAPKKAKSFFLKSNASF